MNQQAEITSTALVLPEPTSLAALFQKPDQIDDLISRIEAEVRAHVPDLSTKKGRDAIASLAHKVARSKTALDNAGKDLNADLRSKIEVVDAERRKIRDRFDALKAEARKPLDDWEAAEDARLEALKARLDLLTNASPAKDTSDAVAALIARVEATMIDDTWAEYLPLAAKAKDATLIRLRAQLAATKQREDEAAELARLRAEAEERARRDAEEAAAKAEADRIKAEQERIAANQKDLADRLVRHCQGIANGMIGGQPQPYAVLMHDLEHRIHLDAEATGDHWPRVDVARQKAMAELKELHDKEMAERQARAEQERVEAAERARIEAKEAAERQRAQDEERHARELAQAKAREEAAAQAERNRIEDERKAEADARAKREADQAHRARIQSEIATALEAYEAAGAMAMADAIIGGAIPHVRAVL